MQVMRYRQHQLHVQVSIKSGYYSRTIIIANECNLSSVMLVQCTILGMQVVKYLITCKLVRVMLRRLYMHIVPWILCLSITLLANIVKKSRICYYYYVAFFIVTTHISVEYKVFPGLDSSNPAASCADIVQAVATAPSGYYWLQSTSGSPVRVYCDMSITCQGVGGGWMRVVNLDFNDTSQECPPNTRVSLFTPTGIRVCGIITDAAACSSSTFSVQGVTYGHVCGRIIGYQQGLTDAFNGNRVRGPQSIDSDYVDGVSLTHGSNPRKHIWTFASARDEVGTFPYTNCPCTNINQASAALPPTPPPSYVGNDYFCDTGSTERAASNVFYTNDPLWDGAGCGVNSTCCTFNNPPWFLKQLPSATTDDIEMRICRDSHQTDERNHVEIIDLYIR